MVVESGSARVTGFGRFASPPRHGSMNPFVSGSASARPAAPTSLPALVTPPKAATAPARTSAVHGRFVPDPDVQMGREARQAILELRDNVRTLQHHEQQSWRHKSKLVREHRFETKAKRTQGDLSAAAVVAEGVPGSEALALGEQLKRQREELYWLGETMRKESRVARKAPLPSFKPEGRGVYTRELQGKIWTNKAGTMGKTSESFAANMTATTFHTALGMSDTSFTDDGTFGATGASFPSQVTFEFEASDLDTPLELEMLRPSSRPPIDPRTASIQRRIDSKMISMQLEPEPEPERIPPPEDFFGPDSEEEEPEPEEDCAEELQQHFLPKPPPPRERKEVSRVEYFRQLDARAKQKAAAQGEVDRIGALVLARQALIDEEIAARLAVANTVAEAVVGELVEEAVAEDLVARSANPELYLSAAAAAALKEMHDTALTPQRTVRIQRGAEAEAEVAAEMELEMLEMEQQRLEEDGEGVAVEDKPDTGTDTPAEVQVDQDRLGGELAAQIAATNAAELLASGGGDDSLRRRVAQRWLHHEILRCAKLYSQ